MRTCLLLIPIMTILFLQYHHAAVSSSYNASATTHLSPHMQKLALFQFKLSMAINPSASPSDSCIFPHPKTTNWSMNSDYCAWDGVTCDQMTGDVIGLNLSCSQLVGAIPPNSTLFQLSLLQTITFDSNDIHGVLPEKIFHLPNLILLDLEFNPHLSVILPKNKWGSTSSLQTLYLGQTTILGQVPDSIGYLKSLTTLDFWNCSLSGPFPRSIVNLSQLIQLELGYNNFFGKIPDSLGNLQHLISLDLDFNNFSGQIPRSIGNLTQLDWLFLHSNKFSGQIPDSLGTLQNLTLLELGDNNLIGPFPPSICNSSSLEILNLSYNNLSGLLPTCPRNLGYNLSVLDLRMNSIGGSLPSTLSNFRKLRSLYLHGNKLEGTIPLSFAEFVYLEVLDLGSNQIHDTFPHCLESLPNLQVLVLKSNKFHGFINNYSNIDHPFTKLRIIDLSYNEFSGHLPEKFIKNFNAMMNGDVNKIKLDYMGYSIYRDSISVVIKGAEFEFVRILTVFTTIDLSKNKFEGEIPEYIGNLKSLRCLNLSHNNLTGQIPSLIGKLSTLESLDLSFNGLVGVIPQELTSLNFLSRLNVSKNDLTGHIPEGAQFNTFENDSYGGNLGLCGRPLSKKCITETKDEDEINEDEGDGYFFSGFTWEAVVIGYGSGVVVGFVVGYMMFMAGKPKWFTGIIARELGLKVRRMEIRHR